MWICYIISIHSATDGLLWCFRFLAHVNNAAVKTCTSFCVDMFSFIMGIYLKNPPARAGDEGSVPGLGRSPGGGNGNPF